MRHHIICQIAFACLLLSSCGFPAESSQNADQAVGTVMSDGMTISINNPDCFSLSVTARKGLLREYTWNGGTRSATLIPRLAKWNGHYGAYSTGSSPDDDWEMHDGINRLLADEAILNYQNRDQLLCAMSPTEDNCREKHFGYTPGKINSTDDLKKIDFINGLPNGLRAGACSAYTDDGLYISVKKAVGPGNGGTLYVTVYRLLVDSMPVEGLLGSANDRVMIVYPNE